MSDTYKQYAIATVCGTVIVIALIVWGFIASQTMIENDHKKYITELNACLELSDEEVKDCIVAVTK